MGCIEFWAINSLLGSAMFFILLLLVLTQEEYFRYPLNEDKDQSVVALVLAAIFYGVLGIVLIFWKMRRERRMQEALNYQAQQSQKSLPLESTIKSQEMMF